MCGPRGRAGDRRPTVTHELRTPLTSITPLSAIVRRDPVVAPPDATLRSALEIMERSRMRSIVIADPRTRVPLGIFTLRDLLRRVTLPGGDLGGPIASVMTSGLITLGEQATTHRAALTMARHGVGHVIVVDAEGKLVGVVSRDDLFGLQRVGVREVSEQIAAAGDLEALRAASARIRPLADELMTEGIVAETLTHFFSTLNDLLTIRTIEVTADEFDLLGVPFCWIALGSEGRLEQTFSTDQDNGIVFEAADADVETVRAALLPFAKAVNDRLAACGYPLCRGGVMAGNPAWCLPLRDWVGTFRRWIFEPDPVALLNSAIFFDLRPIFGVEALAERVRESVLSASADHPQFLRLLAETALQSRPPLGVIRPFVYDGSKEFPHTIDLKLHGARLFVDAARVLALQNRVPHTSTAERLRAIADAASFDARSLAGLLEGFYFIHMLRLRNQSRMPASRGGANRVDPRDLNDVDRRMLREALLQARKLQTRVALDYRL